MASAHFVVFLLQVLLFFFFGYDVKGFLTFIDSGDSR